MTLPLPPAWRALAAAFGLLAAGPSLYPDGTTRPDPARAWPSFVLFTGGDETARLGTDDGRERELGRLRHAIHAYRCDHAFLRFLLGLPKMSS